MTIRQLEPHEIIQSGDLVTITSVARDGYRPLRGQVGIPAGEYHYSIYRDSGEQDTTYTHDKTVQETEFGDPYYLEDGIIGDGALVTLVAAEGERQVCLNRDDIAAILAKVDGKPDTDGGAG